MSGRWPRRPRRIAMPESWRFSSVVDDFGRDAGRLCLSRDAEFASFNTDAAIAPRPFPRPAMGRGRGHEPALHSAAERLSAQTDRVTASQTPDWRNEAKFSS